MRIAYPSITFAALLLPLAPAAAQGSGCAPLALLGDPGADLSKLNLQMGADGLIDIVAGQRDVLLSGATKCDLTGPADQFDLSCEWHTANESDAHTRFQQLRTAIGQCLKGTFGPDPDASGTDNMQVLDSYKGTVGADEDGYGGTDVSLELVRYTFGDGDVVWWVPLEISH